MVVEVSIKTKKCHFDRRTTISRQGEPSNNCERSFGVEDPFHWPWPKAPWPDALAPLAWEPGFGFSVTYHFVFTVFSMFTKTNVFSLYK